MKLSVVLVILLTPAVGYVFGAGPVVHGYCAQEWMKLHAKHYTEREQRLFIVGTLFPDIRYLGLVDRDKTHEDGVTMQGIKNCKDPFEAGKKLHAFVDSAREQTLTKLKTYEKLRAFYVTEHQGTFLKLVEDQQAYHNTNISEMRKALQLIPRQIQDYEISNERCREWHTMLRRYLLVTPQQLITLCTWIGKKILNVPVQRVQLWYTTFDTVKNDPTIKADIQYMLNSIIDQFQALP